MVTFSKKFVALFLIIFFGLSLNSTLNNNENEQDDNSLIFSDDEQEVLSDDDVYEIILEASFKNFDVQKITKWQEFFSWRSIPSATLTFLFLGSLGLLTIPGPITCAEDSGEIGECFPVELVTGFLGGVATIFFGFYESVWEIARWRFFVINNQKTQTKIDIYNALNAGQKCETSVTSESNEDENIYSMKLVSQDSNSANDATLRALLENYHSVDSTYQIDIKELKNRIKLAIQAGYFTRPEDVGIFTPQENNMGKFLGLSTDELMKKLCLNKENLKKFKKGAINDAKWLKKAIKKSYEQKRNFLEIEVD